MAAASPCGVLRHTTTERVTGSRWADTLCRLVPLGRWLFRVSCLTIGAGRALLLVRHPQNRESENKMTAVQSNGHASAPQAPQVHVERLGREILQIPIEGLSPLLVHNWDPKARAQLPGGADSSKKGRKKKEHPTPEEAYEASRYRLPDGGDGFPAKAFKSAMVDSYHHFDGLKMKWLKTMIFVHGVGPDQLVPIVGEPEMHEAVVRIGMGTANLRHRAIFPEWSATLQITYLPSKLSTETILALVDAAGMGGVGENRPSSPKSNGGTNGMFGIVDGGVSVAT